MKERSRLSPGVAAAALSLAIAAQAACGTESVVGSGGGQTTSTSSSPTTTTGAGGQTTSSAGGQTSSSTGGAGGSAAGAGGDTAGAGGQTTSSTGGTGGSTTTSTTTDPGMTTQACRDCLQVQCVAGLDCGGILPSVCADWLGCWLGCDQTQCYLDCDAQYPDLASVQQTMYECVCATCEQECASGPGGCSHAGP